MTSHTRKAGKRGVEYRLLVDLSRGRHRRRRGGVDAPPRRSPLLWTETMVMTPTPTTRSCHSTPRRRCLLQTTPTSTRRSPMSAPPRWLTENECCVRSPSTRTYPRRLRQRTNVVFVLSVSNLAAVSAMGNEHNVHSPFRTYRRCVRQRTNEFRSLSFPIDPRRPAA